MLGGFSELTCDRYPHTVSGSRTAQTGGHKLERVCDLRFFAFRGKGGAGTDRGGVAGRSPGIAVLREASGHELRALTFHAYEVLAVLVKCLPLRQVLLQSWVAVGRISGDGHFLRSALSSSRHPVGSALVLPLRGVLPRPGRDAH